MTIYTDIPFVDLEKIASHYGFEIIDCAAISGGNANSNYHIQAEDSDYVLTLAEEKSLADMQKLADLLVWLKLHQFITSGVITSTHGETVTLYQGKPILVKQWIAGKVYQDFSIEMLLQIGGSIAKLHQIPALDSLPKCHPYGLQIFATVINKGIDNNFELWLEQQIQFLTKDLPKDLPKGLIHGDIFFDNVLFEGEEIKAIIDFEEACYYDLMFDIGMAILGLCQTDGNIDLLKAKALIKGYEQIRPLLSIEKKSLPLFIEYAATATAWWRFWKYNIHLPNSESTKKHWDMVKIAKNIKSVAC